MASDIMSGWELASSRNGTTTPSLHGGRSDSAVAGRARLLAQRFPAGVRQSALNSPCDPVPEHLDEPST
jgi:hypothetical protein